MKGNSLGTIFVLFVSVLLYPHNLSARVPGAGVYPVWASDSQTDGPFVDGFHITRRWGSIDSTYDPQTKRGVYNFEWVKERIAMFNDLDDPESTKRMGSLDINGATHPQWMFTYDNGGQNAYPGTVPYCTYFPESNGWHVQVQDTLGVPMYWHSSYKAEYLNLLTQLDDYLTEEGLYEYIVGFRMNFNAIGSEKFSIPTACDFGSFPERWLIPTEVDAQSVVNVTSALRDDYRLDVVEHYIDSFAGKVQVFCRNDIAEMDVLEYLEMAESAGRKIAWFHTSSEVEPKARWIENQQYDKFYYDSRPGYRAGYAEPFATSWGDRGAGTDPRWASPPQWNYWTNLVNLHCGVSFIAVYGADINVAMNGKYRYASDRAEFPALGNDFEESLYELDIYKDEFSAGLEFAHRYAGYHVDPENSPGAWVAFRENLVTNYEYSLSTPTDPNLTFQDDAYKYDYTFLVDSVVVPDRSSKKKELEGGPNGEERDYSPAFAKTVGPTFRRYGAYALKMVDGDVFEVNFDDRFINSLQVGSTLRLVVLNDGSDSVEVKIGTNINGAAGLVETLLVEPNITTIDGTGYNDWSEYEIELEAPMLLALRNGASIQIDSVGAGQTDIWLHMLEVRRCVECLSMSYESYAESLFGSGATGEVGPLDDIDRDGLVNYAEYVFGTDITRLNRLSQVAIEVGPNANVVRWTQRINLIDPGVGISVSTDEGRTWTKLGWDEFSRSPTEFVDVEEWSYSWTFSGTILFKVVLSLPQD